MLKHGRRNALFIAAAIASASMLLAGCASQAPASTATPAAECKSGTGNTTVTVWTFLNPNQPTDTRSQALRDIIDSFQSSHPGVTVNVQTQNWTDLETKYLTSVASNTEPDVLWITQGDSATLLQKGVVTDLKSLLGADYIKDLQTKLIAPGVEINGQIPQLPLWPDAGQVNYYRTDQLKKAGMSTPPKTWDEFTTAAAKLSDLGGGKTYGFAIPTTGAPTTSFFFNVATAEGKAAWDNAWKGGKFDFTGSLAKKTAETVKSLVTSGAVPKDNGNLNGDVEQNQFVTGRYAIANMYSPRFTTIKKQASANFDASTINIAGLPTFAKGEKNPVLSNPWGVVASKTPASPACTAAFIKSMYSAESSLTWSKVGGQVPVLKSTLSDPWFKTADASDVKQIASIIQSGQALPLPANIVNLSQTMNAANAVLQSIVTDPNSDINQVLQKAGQAANQ